MNLNLSYDAVLQAVFIATRTVPGKEYLLETPFEIAQNFASIREFWRKNCKGQRVYYVVDFSNTMFDPKFVDDYRRGVERLIMETGITVIQFGGTAAQRSVARLMGIEMHTTGNVYETRKDAITVVRRLQDGTIKAEVA